jgi:hypothetical protein
MPGRVRAGGSVTGEIAKVSVPPRSGNFLGGGGRPGTVGGGGRLLEQSEAGGSEEGGTNIQYERTKDLRSRAISTFM